MILAFKNMLLWVLPLILFISVQPLKAQETVVFKVYTTDAIDVCTNERRVIVIVSLGKIEKKDSLLYFDLELKYDPTKVKFDQILTSGTLSEQFAEMKAVGDFSGVGYARAFAGNFTDIPVAGDKPLIAFLGRSLSNCPDTSEVQLTHIDWLGFKRTISDTQNAIIIAREKISPNRLVSLTSVQDTVSLNDTNQIEKVNFTIKGSAETKVREGVLKVDYNRASFKISQIVPVTTNIEILKIDSIDSGIEISFKALDTNYQASREIQASFERIKDTNELSFAKVYIKQVNTCSCVSFLKDTVRITVRNAKRIINSVDENTVIQSFKIIDNKDSWVVEKEGEWEVSLYSVLGQLKGTYQNTGNSVIIGKNSIETGVYLLVLKNKTDHSQEIRILNK